MKNLFNLKGAKLLSKTEQKAIKGGDTPQHVCEMTGGTWVCVGIIPPGACGCVYPAPNDPPIE